MVAGAGSTGSGVVIYAKAGQALVLTAKHVTHGHSAVRVTFQDGYSCGGRILGEAAGGDVSAILCQTPSSTRALPVAEIEPAEGADAELAGFGMSGSLRHYSATLLPDRWRNAYGRADAVLDRPVSPGDSGGPVIYRSRTVAIIWGTDGYKTHCTRLPVIRTFLRRVAPWSLVVVSEQQREQLPTPSPSDEKPSVQLTQEQLQSIASLLWDRMQRNPSAFKGQRGEAAAPIDYDEILRRLPPQVLRIYTADKIHEQRRPLGEPLEIRNGAPK